MAKCVPWLTSANIWRAWHVHSCQCGSLLTIQEASTGDMLSLTLLEKNTSYISPINLQLPLDKWDVCWVETDLLLCWSPSCLCTVSAPWTSGHRPSVPSPHAEPPLPAPPDKGCRSAPPSQTGSTLAVGPRLHTAPSAPWHSWRSKHNPH